MDTLSLVSVLLAAKQIKHLHDLLVTLYNDLLVTARINSIKDLFSSLSLSHHLHQPELMDSWAISSHSSGSVTAFQLRQRAMTASKISKVKRGLPGFVNGSRVSALPDTGSSRNVVSQDFSRERKLQPVGTPSDFLLGNSQRTRSLGRLFFFSTTIKLIRSLIHTGTVAFDWAFSDNPKDQIPIVCDVLPDCSYSIILGSRFLAETQTLSKYKRRLTHCLFSGVNVLKMNFLEHDDKCQRLLGSIGDGAESFAMSAVADTGAEGNVMDYRCEPLLPTF